MTNRFAQLGGLTATVLAIAATAQAEVKLNDNFSVAGYAAGSYQTWDEADTDRFDIDAAKVSFLANYAPVTGVASIYYRPGSDDVTLLDVYATYDFGAGSSITAGKFLSYLGFEAFDIPNMYQISYANGDFLGAIPGYHSGVKYDYTSPEFQAGVAVLDAVYGGLKADGEAKENVGYEGFVSYTGVKGLTLWAGFAYQDDANPVAGTEETLTLNFWASYQLNEKTLVAAEYTTKDSDTVDGYNWLAFFNYALTDKAYATLRISGEDIDNGPRFTKFTVSPGYNVTANLTVRAEVSLYDYSDHDFDRETYIGVQGILKF